MQGHWRPQFYLELGLAETSVSTHCRLIPQTDMAKTGIVFVTHAACCVPHFDDGLLTNVISCVIRHSVFS